MNQRDLLILFIYSIVVIFVFFRMIESLEKEVGIQLNQESLNKQIAKQNLQDVINITFRLLKTYQLEKLYELPIAIENKSKTYSVYVDWDASSITDFIGRSRRVVRLPPGTTLDLLQPQVFSFIAPNKILRETITAEDILKRTSDTGTLKTAAPLFDMSRLAKGPLVEKKRYREFVAQAITLPFSLQLLLRLFEYGGGASSTHILYCEFQIRRLTWIETLRWKPKIFPR